MKKIAFLIQLNGKIIETVYYPMHLSVYQVKEILLTKGYNENILVYVRSY